MRHVVHLTMMLFQQTDYRRPERTCSFERRDEIRLERNFKTSKMSFSIHNSSVALCNNERVVIHNVEDNTSNAVDLPRLQEKKVDVHNNVEIEAFHMITSLTFSDDGKYLVVCTNRKQLCLYEKETLKLLSNRTLTRAASKVRFTPSNDVVVADKAGDAYLFSTTKPDDGGSLLLGHLSMLLDILVTYDEKYIITTDRDEKIRVSMFPNCYNILSYCLLHTKFVTNISELPHEKNIVVSAGGDGLLVLWDYKLGKELLCVDFHDKISTDDIKVFDQCLQEYQVEEHVESLPVKHLRLFMLDDETSIAVLSFHSNSLILVYKICGKMDTGFEATYLQSLNTDTESIEFHIHEKSLWVLTNSGFKVYDFNGTFEPSEKVILEKLNKSWELLRTTVVNQHLFPILYKRRYDNVQEYLERKKMRLENTTEHS